MCVLGIGDAISKKWGPEITAEKVIPQLTPLLVCKTLARSQFSTYVTIVTEMIGRIEAKSSSFLVQQEPNASARNQNNNDLIAAEPTNVVGWEAFWKWQQFAW